LFDVLLKLQFVPERVINAGILLYDGYDDDDGVWYLLEFLGMVWLGSDEVLRRLCTVYHDWFGHGSVYGIGYWFTLMVHG
jgi:hypothetical protein